MNLAIFSLIPHENNCTLHNCGPTTELICLCEIQVQDDDLNSSSSMAYTA